MDSPRQGRPLRVAACGRGARVPPRSRLTSPSQPALRSAGASWAAAWLAPMDDTASVTHDGSWKYLDLARPSGRACFTGSGYAGVRGICRTESGVPVFRSARFYHDVAAIPPAPGTRYQVSAGPVRFDGKWCVGRKSGPAGRENPVSESIPHYYLYGETSPVSELEFVHVETIRSRIREYHWGDRSASSR